MNDKFFIAWWGGMDFGEMSTVFTDRKAAGKWLISKMEVEEVINSGVEGFANKSDAEYYVDKGRRRE